LTKICKHCGSSENLKTRIVRGKQQILTICNTCFSIKMQEAWKSADTTIWKKNISKGTKEAIENYSDEKLESMIKNHNDAWFSKSEEEKKEICIKRGKAITNSPLNNNRKKKLSVYWGNAPKEVIDNRTKKAQETIKNNSVLYELEKFVNKSNTTHIISKNPKTKKKKSTAQKKKWEELSLEKKEKKLDELRISSSIWWETASKEQLENRKKKHLNSIKIRTPEKEKNWSIGAQKAFMTKHKNGSSKISKGELKCLNYIKENIDSEIQHQVPYNNWVIDFYSPKFNLYIQFDGIVWHGLKETEALKKSKLWDAIIKNREKDRMQDQTIFNLIRITDEEFYKNSKIVEDKIYEKLKSYTNL